MRAMIYRKYGSPDVLRLEHRTLPKMTKNELLVRVKASSVNPIDWKLRQGFLLLRLIQGFFLPRKQVLGFDFSGYIESVGRNVRQYVVGDEVFGAISTGAYAEYMTINASRGVAKKPANMSFNEAACVPLAGITALQGLRDKAGIKQGDRILINGASGGVGAFAVQLAVAFGAKVTAVTSEKNTTFVKSLGASHVIYYTKQDVCTIDQKYEVVFDAVGTLPYRRSKRLLSRKGKFVTASMHLRDVIPLCVNALTRRRRIQTLITRFNGMDLDVIRKLIESGYLHSAIDTIYPLEDLPLAHRHSETGHVKGKIAISME